MNRVIKLLLISDIFTITGFGFIDPIFAVFLKEDLAGSSLFAVGLASSIFFVVKSIIQVPFSKHVDTHDDADDLRWLITGLGLIIITPIIYIFATHINTIYIAQAIYGLGAGLAYPAWLGLWSTHLDKKHESYEWSLYSALVGLGTASSALIGGAIAQYVGFQVVFLIVAILATIGASILFFLFKNKKDLSLKMQSSYYKKRKIVKNRN